MKTTNETPPTHALEQSIEHRIAELRRMRPELYAKFERLVERLDSDPTLIDAVTEQLDAIEVEHRRGRS